MLIVLSIATLLVAQLVLWVAIKHFRRAPDDADNHLGSVAYREAAWWLVATIVVLIILCILIGNIYRAQRVPAEAMLAM
jgi:heme/copper-type cytochrome/quinol oxidase subunit 2